VAQELSPHKRARIVDLYFQGYSQTSVAPRLGINQSTVSRCLREFGSIVEQEGVETLEKELGTVMNDFRSLHNLAAELKKCKLSVEEAHIGLKIHRLFQEFEIAEDDYGALLLSVKKMHSEGFITSALKLAQLEASTGKSYVDIVSEFESLSSEVDNLGKSRANLKQENKALRGDNTKLTQANKNKRRESQKLADEMKQKQSTLNAELTKKMEETGLTMMRIEKLEPLTHILKQLHIADDKLEIYLKEHQKLEDLGITWENFKTVVEAMKNETKED
jgi:predicted transcriptional regulator